MIKEFKTTLTRKNFAVDNRTKFTVETLLNKQRTRSIKAFVPFNKLTSVFHASVLLLIMNFVITLSK